MSTNEPTTRALTATEASAVLFSAECDVRADAEEIVPLGMVMAEYDRRGAELARMRQVIRDYVNHVESGERFDALARLVPGLQSDGGRYGAATSR